MATTAAPASLEERIARLEAQRNAPMPTERLARIEGAYEHLATKADLQTVKADIATVKADIATVKSELQGEIAAVKADIATVKSELQGDIAAVRSELQGDIAAVRSDIATVKSELQGEMADVRVTVQAVQSEQRALKWMMGIGIAGILFPLLRDLLAQLP